MTRRGAASLGANPVLVGAATTLIIIVAVFLAYNANTGLPFVPTYRLTAEVPSAANLVVGNEVRIGGGRVGIIDEIEPVERDGRVFARLSLKLDQSIKPIPADSTFRVRPRSALGLKYLQLVTGSEPEGLPEGGTLKLASAEVPVEFDEFVDIFDPETRANQQKNLEGYGTGFALRGTSLNEAIESLRPLVTRLRPVARNLADPDTELRNFFKELGDAARIVRPEAVTQGQLFVNLETTFAALAEVADSITATIERQPPTIRDTTASLKVQRPFLANFTALARELQPGAEALPDALPPFADALEIGTPLQRRAPALNRRLGRFLAALEDLVGDAEARGSVRKLRELVTDLEPGIDYVAPYQTDCAYLSYWFAFAPSLLSSGDNLGTNERVMVLSAPAHPDNEGSALADAPANGGPIIPQQESAPDFLHQNPYPRGVAGDCEAGRERYRTGKQTFGSPEGDQGSTLPPAAPAERAAIKARSAEADR